MIYQTTEAMMKISEVSTSDTSFSPLAIVIVLIIFTLTFIASGVLTYRIMRKKSEHKDNSSHDKS